MTAKSQKGFWKPCEANKGEHPDDRESQAQPGTEAPNLTVWGFLFKKLSREQGMLKNCEV